MARYWIAYIGDGPHCVEYKKFDNKMEVIDWLMMGFSSDNWTTLCPCKESCKKEVDDLLWGWDKFHRSL